MSTQDPYGSQDQPREQRTGSSAEPSNGYGQQAPSGYSQQPPSSYGQQPPAGYQGQPPAGYGSGSDRPAPRNGLGIAALVAGIIALVFSWTIVAGLLGLVAIVLGFMGSRRAKRGEATNRGMAITGIVLGALSVLVAAVVLVFALFVGSRAANCTDLAAQGASEQAVQQCIADQLGVDTSSLDG